ncbi:MAG TPA: chromate efflux transporter [Candidatus Dormibacteraeota bacterium]|nr:chromate efflux transporter [Candidatus Dormibacteraeota bacterium]
MLIELALVFLKLGVIGFGGPAAHVALMRRELVTRRCWLDPEEFNRMFAACNLIPGPSSTELAIFLGRRRAGWRGMVIAGAGFILPAALLMLAIAWAYVRWGRHPAATHLLAGVRPIVVGIVAWAAVDLGRTMVTDWARAGIAILAAAMLILGLSPALTVVLGGAVLMLRRHGWPRALVMSPLGGALVPASWLLAALFLAFLKVGALSFGSGYVLVAFLRADLVQAMAWLTDRQLVDAIAIAQATPGPVYSVAAFIGYLIGGVPGSVVATAGIFLPGFALIPFVSRVLRLVEHHAAARAFVDGANAAALGLIAAVALQLAGVALSGLLAVVAAVVTVVVMLRWPLASPALVVGGAAAGLAGVIGYY